MRFDRALMPLACLTLLALAPPDSARALEPTPADCAEVARWVPLLASDDCEVRDQASQELEDLGPRARAGLESAYEASADPEARLRLSNLVNRWEAELRALGNLYVFRIFEARSPGPSAQGGHAGYRLTYDHRVMNSWAINATFEPEYLLDQSPPWNGWSVGLVPYQSGQQLAQQELVLNDIEVNVPQQLGAPVPLNWNP
ncbi:MAG: hypothetical protein M5U26_26040 [Planctomycetota bacterium]|nr:hypothetical protein [Planctomycetota bacterium]